MKTKPEWKIRTIKELRKERISKRIIGFVEIIYTTIIPILFTYLFIKQNNILFLLPILFILFFRLKYK